MVQALLTMKAALTLRDKAGKVRLHIVAKTSRGFNKEQLDTIARVREEIAGFNLRWRTVFFPDWSTGFGKGEPTNVFASAPLEITERSKDGRHRYRVVGTNLQAFLTPDEITVGS